MDVVTSDKDTIMDIGTSDKVVDVVAVQAQPSASGSGQMVSGSYSGQKAVCPQPVLSGARIAYGLVRQYPDNFDHVRYLKFLKESVIQSAREEVEIAKLIAPFYNSLPSYDRSKTVKDIDEPVPHVHLEEPSTKAIENIEFKTLEMKVKATVSAVMLDNRVPKREHLLFLRSTNQLIVDLLTFSGFERYSKSITNLLTLASVGVDHLFNCNVVKYSEEEEYLYGLEDTGVEYVLNHLVDFIIRDYKDPFDQMCKTDIVEAVIRNLKPTPIRRRLFELLCTGVKTCLSHIHRGDRNVKNDGVLPMMYVETLFRYLMIVEQIIAMLPCIQETELVTLECIERTVAGSLKYPLISIFVARIATLAANRPRIPPPFVRRRTGLTAVRKKTPVKVKVVYDPNEDEIQND